MTKSCAYFTAYILLLLTLASCHKKRVVNNSFYYWKTVYEHNAVEDQYFNKLHCTKLYIRIMDVAAGDGAPAPVSPVTFKHTIPHAVQIVPVVFIVNEVLRNQTNAQLDNLAAKIVYYVSGKVKQSGKVAYNELQIDCDWTRTTRDNYFYLLKRIKSHLGNKILTATLRLHQLKNQKSNGVPPVSRVMLMCYNMGNLRQYGPQNSILEQSELQKYIGSNLSDYHIPIDIGLPLFSWAVVFRHGEYAGISKRLNEEALNDKMRFKVNGANMYILLKDEPALGLKRGDKIRWERIPTGQLQAAANFIQKHLSTDTLNIIYFHLDEPTLKHYTYEDLEKTTNLFR